MPKIDPKSSRMWAELFWSEIDALTPSCGGPKSYFSHDFMGPRGLITVTVQFGGDTSPAREIARRDSVIRGLLSCVRNRDASWSSVQFMIEQAEAVLQSGGFLAPGEFAGKLGDPAKPEEEPE